MSDDGEHRRAHEACEWQPHLLYRDEGSDVTKPPGGLESNLGGGAKQDGKREDAQERKSGTARRTIDVRRDAGGGEPEGDGHQNRERYDRYQSNEKNLADAAAGLQRAITGECPQHAGVGSSRTQRDEDGRDSNAGEHRACPCRSQGSGYDGGQEEPENCRHDGTEPAPGAISGSFPETAATATRLRPGSSELG